MAPGIQHGVTYVVGSSEAMFYDVKLTSTIGTSYFFEMK